MECYTTSKTMRDEMTVKWKSKMYNCCRECYQASIKGKWTDIYVAIAQILSGRKYKKANTGAAFEKGI